MRKLIFAALFVVALFFGILLTFHSVEAKPEDEKVFFPLLCKSCSGGTKFERIPGSISGVVYDGSSKERVGVPGAQVCLGATCVTTDQNGRYLLNQVGSGDVTVSADEYTPVTVRVDVNDFQVITQDFALSRLLSLSGRSLEVILTWDSNTHWSSGVENDLDANMLFSFKPGSQIPSQGTGDCTQVPYACLEKDHREGFGPETITIQQFETGVYYFGVLNVNQGYAGVPDLIDLNALAYVYDEKGLFGTYRIPDTGEGDFWYAFRIDATNYGATQEWELTVVNCLTTLPGDGEFPTCPSP